MASIRCENCGEEFSPPSRVEVARCPSCQTPAAPLHRLPRVAAELLRERIRSQPELPDALREDLLERVSREVDDLREQEREALSQVGPPAPESDEVAPPPLPARSPETSRTERPGPAPAPRKPAPPGIWSKLGPVFAENLLFALAAFLLVAGAVYFVTTAWTTMSGMERRLVVIGGLVVLGGILFAASRLVNRDDSLPEAERLLLLVVAFLLPLAAAPAGELFESSLPAALACSALVLGLGYLAVGAVARVEDPALAPGLPVAALALAILIVLGPRVAEAPMSAGAVAAAVLLAISILADRRVVPLLGPRTAPLAKGGLLLGFSALVFAGVGALSVVRAGQPATTALAVGGVVLAGAGLAAAGLEASLARAGRLPGGRGVPVLLAAIALAIAGAAVATGNERGFLAACVFGAAAGMRAGLRLPGGAFLVPGLALSVLAYLYLPAPVRELATRGRDLAARGLGYEPERFPISFYGVTFLPYVAAAGAFGVFLRRRGREAHGRVVLGWTVLLSIALAALALFAGEDLRAPAAVLAAQGVLLLALSRLARLPLLATLGVLGVLAGVHCGISRLAPPPGLHILALTGLGGAFLAASRRLAADAGSAVLDGVAVAALATTLVLLHGLATSLRPLGPEATAALLPAGGWDLAGYPGLAVLLVALAGVYRRPEFLIAAFLPLLRTAQTASDLVGAGPGSAIPALALAAAGGTALALGLRRFRDHLPSRPTGADRDPVLALPGCVLAVAGIAVLLLVPCRAAGSFPVAAPAGLLGLAVVLFLAGRTAGQAWAAGPAFVLLPLAGLAVAGSTGADFLLAPGLLGAAAGLSLAVAAFAWLDGADALETGPMAVAIPSVALPALGWALVLLPLPEYREAGVLPGCLLAAAGALLAASARFAIPIVERRSREAVAIATGLAGGVAIALVPVGLLDAFRPRLDLYPLGLLLAAAATAVCGLGSRVFSLVSVGHLAAALAVALAAGVSGAGDGRLLLLAFAGVFEGGRIAARSLPRLGGLLLLLAALGGLSFALGERVLALHPRWQPPIWLLFAAGALVAHRIPALRIHPLPARIVAIPILFAATGAGLLLAGAVALAEPSTTGWAPADLLALAVGAGAYVAAVLPLLGWRRSDPHAGLQALALAIAASAFPLLNIAVHGNFRVLHRPDLEVALVAVFYVFRRELRSGRIRFQIPLSILLAAALGLTAGDVSDITTSLTLLAASAAPLAVFLRGENEEWLDAAALGTLLAAFALVVFLVPKTGRPAAEILPLLGVVSAVFAAGFARAVPRIPPLARATRTAVRVPAAAAALAVALVAGNAIALNRVPADAVTVVLAGIACAVPALGFALAFRRGAGAAAIRGAGAAAIAFYALLALRTPALDLLRGHHLHVLAAAGLALFLFAETLPERIRAPLARDALLAPVPAVIAALPILAGSPFLGGSEPSALFLAAVVYGAAGLIRRVPGLVAISAGLTNLALFAVWRTNGIVDPAFYGVPPGLTLLAGAELLSDRLKPEARLSLGVAGAALLYGSVGIQVLRVQEPTHALVLFGLGLATVGAGLLRDRAGYLTLGAAVVVVDVIAYLARHGFEESFLAAGLLVLAGLTVLGVAIASSRRRRRS